MDFSEIDLFEGINDSEAQCMMSCFGAVFRTFRVGATVYDYSESNDEVGVMLKGGATMIRTDENGEVSVMEIFA